MKYVTNERKTFNLITAAVLGTILAVVILICPEADAQTYKVLYSFQCGADGGNPIGGLVRDSAGNLYGTTTFGGASQFGTVFKLAPDGTETVLYSFKNVADGSRPNGSLLRDSVGNLYGTAAGDNFSSYGSVFKLTTDGIFTLLHSFNFTDGSLPVGSLVSDGTGSFYGATSQGGTAQIGTVFRITINGEKFVTLTDFAGSGVVGPTSGVIRDSAGNLYGTAISWVYRVDPNNLVTVLHSFIGPPDGSFPSGGVVRDSSGNLYGTTQSGGTGNPDCDNGFGCGTVFKLDPDGNETILWNFTGKRDGGIPVAGLILDSEGNHYGTTAQGGTKQCNPIGGPCGMVFQVNQSGKEKVLHTFTGMPTDGQMPVAPLLNSGGSFFGTTEAGGSNGCGTVFQYTPRGATGEVSKPKGVPKSQN